MVQGGNSSLINGQKLSRTILIVEDSPEDLELYRRYLRRSEEADYIVVSVPFADQVEGFLRQRTPDCIILDWSLPDSTGLETLEHMNDRGRLPCAVIMITGSRDDSLAVEALKAGAYDYLVKGKISADSLADAIESAITKFNLQNKIFETQERFRTAVDSMQDCFAIFEVVRNPENEVVDFRFDYANREVGRALGRSSESIVGRNLSEIFPDHCRGEVFEAYRNVYLTGESFSGEIVEPVADPELENIRISWDVRASVLDKGIAASWRDTSEHRRTDERIKRLNLTLEKRVAERTSELEELVSELHGFTYTISHDLRAPLRSIIATSRILLSEAADLLPPDFLSLLERQAEKASSLATLIDDLLRLSRISRQEMVLTEIDLSALAASVWRDESNQTDSSLTVSIQPHLIALGDAVLLRLALANLINNAIKFSPNGGQISLASLRQETGFETFYLKDEGIGFDMQYVNKIFTPFERLHREAEFPGTGIGLANVKRIVERHGGKLWVESSPGAGAKFMFSLPRP